MTMRWYFVPPNLNEGSAFQQHLVLVWTTAGHTYAYGFHGVDTIADARALDLELVRHLLQRTRRTTLAPDARHARIWCASGSDRGKSAEYRKSSD